MVKINNSSRRLLTDTKLVKRIAQEDEFATLQRLQTSTSGLTQVDAEKRLKEYGPNEVTYQKNNFILQSIVQAFFAPFTVALWILTLVLLVSNRYFIPVYQKNYGVVLISLILALISVAVNFIKSIKNKDAATDILNMVSVTTNVKRDCKEQELPTEDIVVGDIISVSAGDVIPADMRLLKSEDLFCSSVSLNGETHPLKKTADGKPNPEKIDKYLEYPNILYEGTIITSGSGVGVVFATGSETIFGKLAKNISKNELKETSFH